jgi:hypothetical protein
MGNQRTSSRLPFTISLGKFNGDYVLGGKDSLADYATIIGGYHILLGRAEQGRDTPIERGSGRELMHPRESNVRSAPLHNGKVVKQEYNRVGLALSILAALCFFLALWGLNGFFTARTVVGLGISLNIAALSWGAGWLVHIVVSLIEHHLWRLRRAVAGAPGFVLLGVYGLIIAVGVIDVLTSAIAFLYLFETVGLSAMDSTLRLISTVLAEVIAILPEPTIVWLSVALWRVVKEGRDA